MDDLLRGLQAVITAEEPALMALRRDIHAHPELSREERRTTALVIARLGAAGAHIHPLPGTGVIVDIGPHEPRYRVALRADIDALPIAEATGLPFSSTVEGSCHACGHDVHTAALVGAGLAFAEHRGELDKRGLAIRLVFQHAEEAIPGGAMEILDLGWMDSVDRAYAVHCDPTLDVGEVGLLVGPLTAACDGITVTLKGSGGHTSRPHRTQDLTYALAKVVTDVPAALSRRLDPRAGAALVWGSIHSGNAANVIPSTGTVSGTLRILDADAWESAGPLIEELVGDVVSPYGVTSELSYTAGVPPVVNDAASVEALRAGVHFAGASEAVTRQSLGGEDFAWLLSRTPGAMARLGTRRPGGATYDLHQGDLVVDERAIAIAARLLVGAAVTSIAQLDTERALPAVSGRV
jgi:amidohydrolase